MNQQPDQFFRNKLHGYEKPVSSDIWNRVSGNLPKQNHQMFWLRIAAGAALLITASILIVRFPNGNENPMASQSDRPLNESQNAKKTQPGLPETQAPPAHEGSEKPGLPAIAGSEKKDVFQSRKEPKRSTPAIPSESILENNPGAPAGHKPTDGPLLAGNPNSPEESTAVIEAAVTEPIVDENITIILSSQEVNQKYLKKKNTEAQATSEVKESSGLRKLLDKAYDLKHNQDPFGDLRQKKNEILARNFKNNKRNENQ